MPLEKSPYRMMKTYAPEMLSTARYPGIHQDSGVECERNEDVQGSKVVVCQPSSSQTTYNANPVVNDNQVNRLVVAQAYDLTGETTNLETKKR